MNAILGFEIGTKSFSLVRGNAETGGFTVLGFEFHLSTKIIKKILRVSCKLRESTKREPMV